MNDDGPFLHATLSTADLALSTISAEGGGGLEAKQSTMAAVQQQGGSQAQQMVAAYLFSDEEATDEDVLLHNDVVDEVVPDSSDEASTGPALDMDMDLDIDLGPAPLIQGGPAMGAFIQQQVPMQASASASSATRKAFKTSHVDYAQVAATIDPRNLMGQINNLTYNDIVSRDPKEPSLLPFDMSIATTEVIPSIKGTASSKKTISPDQRPYMLGQALLQGIKAVTSPAEAVKSRARPKAKPLAAAPKEIRHAIRGKTPPRESSKQQQQLRENPQGVEADDEDDELRLGGPSSKPASSKNSGREATSKLHPPHIANAKIIDLASEEEDELNRTTTKSSLPSKSKIAPISVNKSKAPRVESDSDDDNDGRGHQRKQSAAFDLDEDLLGEIEQVNAKGSEEDEDYNGKSTGRDSRWDKGKGKAKKKTQARKSDRGRSVSKAPSEDPPIRPNRTKRTTGRPSAVFSATKRAKDGKVSDTEGLDSEDSLHVNSLRQDLRKRKTDTLKESKGKGRASKGTPPRSKEYLDDEDMADDEPIPPLNINNRKQNSGKDKELMTNVSVAEDTQIALSSDADGDAPLKPRPSKVYGKRANKPVPRVHDSDEEGEREKVAARTSKVSLEHETLRGSSPQQEITAPAVKANTGSNDRERSVSKGPVSNRSRRAISPPYVVVIDNSAKKNRPPMSTKVPRVASKSKLVEIIPKHSSSEASEDEDSDAPLTMTKKTSPKKKVSGSSVKSAFKQKKPVRIVDSEEEEDEELEKTSKKDTLPSEASNAAKAVDTSTRKPLQEQKSILQPKDQNASTLIKAASTASIAEAKSTPKPVLKMHGVLADVKPVISSTGKRFHDMVVAKGGGQGVRSSGLSKRTKVPTLLTFRSVAPPKKKPLPPAPIRKKKKGEEVYSDEDQEELNDQPEEWWDRDDFYAWEQRKRKRAKAKGEIDSEEERELAVKSKKMKQDVSVASMGEGVVVGEVEHFSD